MRILLTRNLGSDWPERWREGDAVEASEDIGGRLLALGFAVRLAASPPQSPEPEPEPEPGAGEESTSGGGSPPTAPAAPRPPRRKRGRKKRGEA